MKLSLVDAPYVLWIPIYRADAMRQLEGYDWPGNVWQLQNIVERLANLSDENQIENVPSEWLSGGYHENRPFSMFGFQRVGDLIWAAADQRARGFLVGATSGRTTLSGEGCSTRTASAMSWPLPYPTAFRTTRRMPMKWRSSGKTACSTC